MSYSQKYCIVQPVATMSLGDEFTASGWPLHVTITGVFALNWSDELLTLFTQLIAQHVAFPSLTGSIEYFGPNQEVKVRLVELNKALKQLHNDAAHFILEHGGSFNDPQHQLDGFRPHATMRSGTPRENQNIVFDQLALIDMFPGGDHTQRRVIRLFTLGR